ncbi:YcxB family protein [Ottowia sp.]|uniref:YcxB family protein n=1 Tax=Ottowia sp. TaxID=1898956 RepID=UPI0039E2F6DB
MSQALSAPARYHVSEEDYVRAGQLFARPTLGAWLFMIALELGCLALAVWGTTTAWRVVGLCAAVGGVLGGALVHWFISPRLMRQHYQRYKAMQEEQTVALAEDGLHFSSPSGASHVRWDAVHRWRRDERYILVYPMPRLFHVVPRRVAEQGFDVAALEAALARHVGPAS